MDGKSKLALLASICCLVVAAGSAWAGVLYGNPPGGWWYQYDGGALDANWDHDNGSDQWDGTAIGNGRPGGVSVLTDGGTTFLRIQDTGDPRDHGMGDPGSNRKIYFTRAMPPGIPSTFLDTGVTLSFRARLANTPPLDDAHPDGGGGVSPWPAGGDGYLIHDGGKGAFSFRQDNGDKIISFALAKASDHGAFSQDGLTFNSRNGTSPSGSVDTGEGTTQMLPVSNINNFHEFWVAVQPDTSGGGTHRVNIYRDGSTTPDTFHVTAGNGDDESYNYLAIGQGSTGQGGAIDVDFLAVHPGALAPGQKPQQTVYAPPPGGWSYMYAANPLEDLPASNASLDGTWDHDNGSDQWDGTAIGSGRPGGADVLTVGQDSFLRIQDTGDPRDHGMGDPGSNRKIGFTRDIRSLLPDGWEILDDGVTMTFRARLATAPPLDDLHPDGGGGTSPWPAGGDGYVIHDGGKGAFGIHQEVGDDQTISFALALPSDHAALGGGQGLVMNNLNGTSRSGTVDTGEAGTLNLLSVADPTAFHEFWVTIQGDTSGGGTHRVDVYMDGSNTPTTFHVTSGTGEDEGREYLSLFQGSTGQSGAVNVDFYGFRPGAFAPGQAGIIASASRGGGSTNKSPVVWPAAVAEDVLSFVDRTHEYNNVPAEVLGADYVQVANNDKTVGDYTLDVTLAQNADLYVLLDNRVQRSNNGQPNLSWMVDGTTVVFKNTLIDIGVDESGDGDIDNTSRLFIAQNVPAGTYRLYEQDDGGSRNMYGVAATLPSFDPTPIGGTVRTGGSDAIEPQIVFGPTGGLQEDSPAFVDRTHEWNDIPDILQGAEYIMIANDDKTASNFSLDVELDMISDVYLFIDDRVGDGDSSDGPALGGGTMDWVLNDGFVDTLLDIGVDENGDGDIDNWSSVFVSKYNWPGTITLGPQDDGGSRNMYGVAAVPVPEPATLSLLGVGLLALARRRRRR